MKDNGFIEEKINIKLVATEKGKKKIKPRTGIVKNENRRSGR